MSAVLLSSQRAQLAQVNPYELSAPMVCEYEYDEGEPPVIHGPQEIAHPGWPANVQLLSCKVEGVEIYDMLSPQQVETIEEAILDMLER